MLRIFKDRQVRRVLIACCFALAFIWVAVRWFDVDSNVVYVFAVLAFILIGALIVVGFIFSFVLHWYMRRDNGMLSKIEAEEQALRERKQSQGENEKTAEDEDHTAS